MEFFGTGQAEVLVPAPVPDDDVDASTSTGGAVKSEGESGDESSDEGGISITVKRGSEEQRLSLENLRKNSIILLVPAAKPGDNESSLADVTIVPKQEDDEARWTL